MARSRRFQQALAKRLGLLDRNLPAALRQDVEALHRTRVASRRLREVLPVIETPADGDRGATRKSRLRVRRLTRALGGVRELDVALELLAQLSAGRPGLEPLAGAARAEILRERAVRYAAMMRTMEDIRPNRLLRDLAAWGDVRHAAPAAEQQQRLRRRLVRRARRLDQAIEAAGSLYAFDRLHAVRIAAKKLRYGLELVQELTRVGTQRLAGRLKQAQDLLGRLHDLEVLAAYVRRVVPAAAAVQAEGKGEKGGLLAIIEHETRQLHADYLASVPALRLVVAACRDEVAPKLHEPSALSHKP